MTRLAFYLGLVLAHPVKRRMFLALVFAMVLAISFDVQAFARCCREGWPDWMCEMFWVC